MNFKNKWLILGIIIVLLNYLYLPYSVVYDNAYYPVFDNQIDEMTFFTFESIGEFFAPNDYKVLWIGNRVQRVFFPSEFNILVWLLFLFGMVPSILKSENVWFILSPKETINSKNKII